MLSNASICTAECAVVKGMHGGYGYNGRTKVIRTERNDRVGVFVMHFFR